MIAEVNVLPANSESAIDDNHDELDLPLAELNLMMRENMSNVQGLLTAIAGIDDRGADLMAQQLRLDVQRR